MREIKLIVAGKNINKIENGVFENVEVEIFNEQADLDVMMEEATRK